MLVAASVALVAAAVGAAAVGFSGNLNALNPIGSPGHPPAADQYSTPPSISSISPTEGTTGTVITITGTAFSGVTSVTINGTAASAFTVHNDTTITATVAAGTGAVGHVEVSKPAGNDSSSDLFYYAAAAPTNTVLPKISGSQNLNGAALALVGNHLSATQGTWSGDPSSFTFQWKDCNASYTSCVDISGATSDTYTLASSDLGKTVKVFVTEHNGAGDTTASSANNDLKGNVGAPNPTADNATISGTPEQGTVLTANHGSWDGDGGLGSITFSYQWFRCGASAPTSSGDCPTAIGSNSSTYTPVLADSGHFLAVHISGSNARGSNGWSLFTSTLTAVDGPTVSSFNPTSGTVGSAVTITGAHFTSVSAVAFNGVSAAQYSVNSATSITAVVPTGATNGPISVTTSIGTGTSTGNFTILNTPAITSFNPTAGGTGTAVTITGSNLFGATAVKFSNTSTSDVTVNGDGTQITTHVPTGATTGKLTVTTPAGSVTSTSIFTVLAIPTVTKFAPTSGVSGNTITLTGKAFTGVTHVTFNGTDALFNFVSDTSITATVPDSATTGHIAVTTAAGTGSSTTDFVVQQTPVITSFDPGTQQAGATVTVTGSNFVGVTAVQLGSTTLPTASVTVNSATQLTLKVPAISGSFPAGDYQISITNLAGTGDSGSSLLHVLATLTAPPAFTIDVNRGHPSSPDFGSDTFAATQVILTPNSGTFADIGVTTVTIGGKTDPSFTFGTGGNAGKIIAHVPAGAITGAVKVTNAKATTTGPTFTVDQPPSALSPSPTSGAPGKSVKISGFALFRFGATTKVKFGTSAPITVANPSTVTAGAPISNGPITVNVPADATDGAIQVEVSGVGSASSTTLFKVVAGPTVSSISPVNGTNGTVVTVTGTHFSGGATPVVKFGSLNGASVKVLDDSHLTAAAPAFTGARPASVDIQVINDAGSSNTLAGAFTYRAAPSGLALNPTHGPANNMVTTLVTITGSNFDGVTSVMFGSKAATVVSSSTSTIVVFAPIGAASGGVKVTTPAGSNTVMPTFVVDQPPTISTFSPAPPAGVNLGGAFTVTGSNFKVGSTSQVDDLTVNGTHLTAGNGTDPGTFKVNSTSSIAATLPNSGVTSGPIVATNTATGYSTSKLNLIVRGDPHIDSFSPGSGVVGNKITITGSNLQGGNLVVTFNGTTASSVVVSSDTSVIATVPAGATTGPIQVARAGFATDTSSVDFVVASKPSVSSFDPASGPASVQATTVVDIQGSNFAGVTGVQFNGKASPFVVVNDSGDITALVPPGASTGKITVLSPAGNVTSSGVFTVDGPPVVTSMTPSSGSAGDVVTINGKNLVGEMGGSADPSGTYVDFHGFFGATIDSITSTQIQVEVPDGAVTGPLLVTDTWGQSAVTPMFTVVNPPDIDNSASGFFNAFTGLPSGKKGQPVIIYGSGFTGTSAVKFNGTASSFQVVADWEIIASVPKGATTGPITVTNAAGTASTAPRNFTILP